MNDQDLHQILEQLLLLPSENECVEFKEAKNQYDFTKLGRYFSALSNEANLNSKKYAWLVFGVDDKHRNIVGTSFRLKNSDLMSLKKEIADKTTDRITFIEIYPILFQNKRVIIFQIPPAPIGIPIAFEGHYYARDHESLVGLNIEKIERIRNQITRKDWSSEIIDSATIEDLSSKAISFAREQYIEKNKKNEHEINQWDNVTFLNKAKITINGKITRTAILLLGKPESDHFLNPAQAKITWILKDHNNLEKDYEHFGCPFILSVGEVKNKIRNIKYRYISDQSLFPDEVDQFDPFIIRESLNNCIAHQDYTLNGKINIVEREDGFLFFSNSGSFIPYSVENVINSDAPESQYRNPFLSNAMVNLNMIDTTGSGIKKMFNIQRNKFFPLPDYDFSNHKVQVTIIGKVIDLKYAKKLAQIPTLTLYEIILLDKISKKKPLTTHEVNLLKTKDLIEGRKPNFIISANVAKKTGNQADYMKQKGIDNEYCKKMIIDYLKKFKSGKKEDFENLLLDKLPDVLDISKKQNKIKNILQSLKKQDIIKVNGKIWEMSKPKK